MNPSRTLQSFRNLSVCIFCTLIWILISAQISQRPSVFSNINNSALRNNPAPHFINASSQTETKRSFIASTFTINADATREAGADTQLLQDLKQQIQGVSKADDSKSQVQNESDEDLFTWTRLAGKRIAATENAADQPVV